MNKRNDKYFLSKKGHTLASFGAIAVFIFIIASVYFSFHIEKYSGLTSRATNFILFIALLIVLFITWLNWAYQIRQRNIYRALFLKEKELHHSENKISQSEARLKRAELISKTGNWEIHLDTNIVTASDGAARIYGVIVNKLTLPEIQKFPLEEYRPLLDKALNDLIEKNIPYDVEFKIRRADSGELRDIHSVAEYDKDNKILFGVFSDITELKKAENEIRLLAHAVESVRECVSITDKNNIIIFLNNAFINTYGYAREELIGKNIAILRDGTEMIDKYPEILSETMREGWKGEIINKKKDGTQFPVFLSTSVITNETGTPIALIGVATDITEIIRDREELIRAKEKAEEMNKLKSSFLSNMSHELRTPMIGILGFSELLRTEIDNQELKKMADSIHIGGKRLLNTLNLVLDLARIESNKEFITLEQVNLNEQLIEILKTFEIAAQDKNLFLKYEPSDKNIHVLVDKRIFGQVINNLVNNAIKFTIDGGICVKADVENENGKDFCAIKVIDTGIGISISDLNIIFEEFRQASEGMGRSFEGTGLGLTITKKSVELMNGTISVDSIPGKGTTFIVRFPL